MEYDVIFDITTIIILFFILLVNIISLFKIKKPHVDDQELTHAFYILKNVITNNKQNYKRALLCLSKKFGVLQNDGSLRPPNDSNAEYKKAKEKIKTQWSIKILRSLTKKTRDILLEYYSQKGFIELIFYELDQDE